MVNRDNYLLARAYLDYLREVRQLSNLSIGRYWSYLKHLLLWADEAPFSRASTIRPSFPTYLASARLDGKGHTFAPATLKKIIWATKRFFTWVLTFYPRKFKKFPRLWIDALRPPPSVEKAPDDHQFVTLDQVRQLVAVDIREDNLALWRDQAGAALLFVSGMRSGSYIDNRFYTSAGDFRIEPNRAPPTS